MPEQTTNPTTATVEDSACVVLSERDAQQVFATVSDPPKPNDAALEAARRLREALHG